MDPARKRRLTWLQKKIEYRFKNLDLLETSMVHRSFVNESDNEDILHNERLEFLGDAVLELVVTQMLYRACKDQPEGEMSKMRARTVNGRSLAAAAKSLGLDSYIRLSRGEESTGGRRKESILANVYEALIGALYIDSGMGQAERRVKDDLGPIIKEMLAGSDLYRDYKTKLQEVSQKRFGLVPSYKVVGHSGPDHAKIFEVEVRIGNTPYGKDKGGSKKEAQQKAAKKALGKLDKDLKADCAR